MDNISAEMSSISLSDKYIIVHKQDSSEWHLSKPLVFKNTIHGTMEPMTEFKEDNKTTYIHMYITDFKQLDSAEVLIPTASIYKMEYSEKKLHAGKTLILIGGVMFGFGLFIFVAFGSTGGYGLSFGI